MSSLLSRRNLDFMPRDWLEADKLRSRTVLSENSRDTIDPIVDLCSTIAERAFASHLKHSDTSPPYHRVGVSLIPENELPHADLKFDQARVTHRTTIDMRNGRFS